MPSRAATIVNVQLDRGQTSSALDVIEVLAQPESPDDAASSSGQARSTGQHHAD
jgi:hypothetical protein